MTHDQASAEKKSRWRETWPVIVVSIGYMIPLFWLWSRTGFPDSLGVHITAHGKVGLLENWWYSYLLIQQGGFWNVATFIYVWGAIVGIAAWLGRAVMQDRKANRALKSDHTTEKGRP